MKKGLWLKLFLCTLMLVLSVVLMASCTAPEEKGEPKKPPKKVTLVVDGVEYDQLQTGDKMPEPPAKDGYVFEGWYNGTQKVDKIPSSSDKDLTLTGKWTPAVYDITFENTKGTANENAVSFTIESGTITLLPLEMTGYIFDGWFVGGVRIEQIATGSMGNLTLVAKWMPVSYDIIFDNVTGATNENTGSFTVEDGKIVLEEPSRPGYSFDGWFAGGEEITEIDTTVAQSVTVRAEWTPIVFDILFENTKDAQNDNESRFTVESDVIRLLPLEMDGYRFLGWYVDSVCIDRIPAGTVGSVTLRAEWETVRYDIVFEDTKGVENPNDTFFTVEDDTVTLLPLEKEGYKFDGWFINNVLVTEFDVNVLGTVTVTAKWTPKTYDIVFENTKDLPNSNQMQFTPDSNTITLLPLGDKDGYRFVGWYAGNVFVETIPAGTVGNVTLRAEWEAIRFDIIYVDTKGATNPNDTFFTVEDDTVTLLPIEKEGYEFEGWYINNVLVTEFDVNVLGTVTVTAKWTAIGYTITYEDTKDAENGNPASFTADSADIDLLPLEKEGYRFLGWFVGDDPCTYIYSGTVGDLVLTAKWEKITYTITYDNTQDAQNDNVTSYDVESDIITLLPLEREGYSFDGWFVGGVKFEQIATGTTGDMTLVAKWSVVTYTVTLENTKGATDQTELSYTLFGGVKLPTLSKTGYTFEGWYNENDERVTEIVTGTTGDMTLVAKWTATVYSITYDNVGENTHGNPTTYTAEDGEIILAALPNGDGIFFGGWYLDGVRVEKIPAGTTGDLVLTADWRIPVYTVEDLQNMTLEGNYMLMNDLDLEGMEWMPIGSTRDVPFVGNFSGGGHTISNFKITDGSLMWVGLFGTITGSVSDLSVEDFTISLTPEVYTVYAGGIAGQMNGGHLVNCSVEGTIEILETSYSPGVIVGGMVGYYFGGSRVSHCYSACDITVERGGNTRLGGLIGSGGANVELADCAVVADITVDFWSKVWVGGLLGQNSLFTTVKQCTATGVIDLAPEVKNGYAVYAGGLIGEILNEAVAIRDCDSTVDIEVWASDYSAVGGVLGSNSHTDSVIADATYTGTIDVTKTLYSTTYNFYAAAVGGIAGEFDGAVENCTVDMETTIIKDTYTGVGGLIGFGEHASIKDSYARASITLTDSQPQYMGGLAGWADSIEGSHADVTILFEGSRKGFAGGLAGVATSIKDSHATVDIRSNAVSVGGLVGELGDTYTAGKISNSYVSGTISKTTTGNVGGLIGQIPKSGVINGSYANVTIEVLYTGTPDSQTIYVGGLIGLTGTGTTVSNCYADADIHADGVSNMYAGGLIGCNNGTIENSYAIGTLYARSDRNSSWTTSLTYAGGIVGYDGGDTIKNCFASVDITAIAESESYGKIRLGYIAGYSYGVQNCYYDENAVCQYGYANDEVLTAGVTSTTETATPMTSENFKSREWIVENLWDFEIDYWLFDGENYPVFNEEFIKNSFIEIGTAEELLAMSGKNLSLNYKLMADIDLGNAEWTPILSVNGIFDGNGYTISNLRMTSSGYTTYGFIGTNAGTVRGVVLNNVVIDGSNYDQELIIGALVAYNKGTIENCGITSGRVSFYSKSTSTSGYISIGGLVGENDGVINGCFSYASVSTRMNYIKVKIGGLVGFNPSGSILNSYATGSVSGELSSSVARGKSYVYAGGLVGEFEEGRIAYCYATGDVYASGASATAGGLIGLCSFGKLDCEYLFACSSNVRVYSSYYTIAGGFTTNAPNDLTEKDCYSYSGMRVYSQKESASGYSAVSKGKAEMIAIMAENWAPSIWSFSDSEYPTLIYFAN